MCYIAAIGPSSLVAPGIPVYLELRGSSPPHLSSKKQNIKMRYIATYLHLGYLFY